MTRTLLAVLLLVGCPKVSGTESPSSAARVALPTAAEVFDANARALGTEGLEPVAARMEAAMSMAGQELGMTMLMLPPDQLEVRMAVPGVGEIVQGFDGEVGWELNPLMGPRLLEGEELAEMRVGADQRLAMDLARLYPEARVAAREAFQGVTCWRLELVNVNGKPETKWYDVVTGLEVGNRKRQRSDLGEVEVTTTYEDWRPTAHGLTAFRVIQRIGDLETVMSVREYELGVQAPPLAPPPEIVELLGAREDTAPE